jgi:hypothetical protein
MTPTEETSRGYQSQSLLTSRDTIDGSTVSAAREFSTLALLTLLRFRGGAPVGCYHQIQLAISQASPPSAYEDMNQAFS